MKAIVDRFENNSVVLELEDGQTIDVQRSRCPLLVKVGDTVYVAEDDTISVDEAETSRRKKEIEALAEDLFE